MFVEQDVTASVDTLARGGGGVGGGDLCLIVA